MPDILAGVGIQGDNGGEEQVVATLGAANLLVDRGAVAGAQVDPVVLGVVGHGVPHGAAATVFPPLAGPGLGGHRHGVIFEAVGGVAGHHVKAPRLLAGGGVVGGDIAPHRAEVAAAKADHHLAIKHPGRAGDIAGVLFVDGLHTPQLVAGFGVEGDQATVVGAGVDLALPEGDAADAPAAPQLVTGGFGGLGIMLPQQLAGLCVHGVNDAVAPGKIEHTIHSQGRGKGVGHGIQILEPGQAEAADVIGIDLLEGAVVVFAEGPPIGRPVGAIGFVGEAVIVDDRRSDGLGVHGGGNHRGRQQQVEQQGAHSLYGFHYFTLHAWD